MSTTTTTVSGSAQTLTVSSPPKGRMALDGELTNYGDFRDALNRDGYAVVKGAIPRDRADGYSDAFYSYLENL